MGVWVREGSGALRRPAWESTCCFFANGVLEVLVRNLRVGSKQAEPKMFISHKSRNISFWPLNIAKALKLEQSVLKGTALQT